MTILRKPVALIVEAISPGQVSRQIANAHTLFNLINVIIQLPFANLLVRVAEWLVPGEDKAEGEAKYLDDRILETPSIALGQAAKEIIRMSEFVEDNLMRSGNGLIYGKQDEIEKVLNQEQKINKLEKEIMEYLVKLSNAPLSVEQHNQVNILFYVVNDIERIADHAENIVELGQERLDNNLEFTEGAINELNIMFEKCQLVFKKTILAFKENNKTIAKEVMVIEEEVNALENENRKRHIDRLNKGQCLTSPGVIFLDVISNLERVSDHSSNIAMYILDENHVKRIEFKN